MTSPEHDPRPAPELADWQVSPPRDPVFRARVWARIETAKAAGTWPRYVRAHPAALAGLAVAVALGAITGREQAKARASAESDQLASAYVQSMDARLMRMP